MGVQEDMQAGQTVYANASAAANGSLMGTVNTGLALAKGADPGLVQRVAQISAQIAQGYAEGAAAGAAAASLLAAAGVATAGVPIFGAAVGVIMAVMAGLVVLFGAHEVIDYVQTRAEAYAGSVMPRQRVKDPGNPVGEKYLAAAADAGAPTPCEQNYAQCYGAGGPFDNGHLQADELAARASAHRQAMQYLATSMGESGALVQVGTVAGPFGTQLPVMGLDPSQNPQTIVAMQRYADWGMVDGDLTARAGDGPTLWQDPRAYVIAKGGAPDEALQLLMGMRWAFDAGDRDAAAAGEPLMQASGADPIDAAIGRMANVVGAGVHASTANLLTRANIARVLGARPQPGVTPAAPRASTATKVAVAGAAVGLAAWAALAYKGYKAADVVKRIRDAVRGG